MPDIAKMSENLRNAKKMEIYPFSQLPYSELERALVIMEFE